MRGDLIFQFKAVYKRVDETEYDTANVDPMLGTPVLVDDGRLAKFKTIEEAEEIKMRCQIYENPKKTIITDKGQEIKPMLMLLHHYRDIEMAGLLNSDNNIDLRIGDRLVRIEDKFGRTVKTFGTIELFVMHISDAGFGIDIVNPTRNLVEISFNKKDIA